MHCIVFPVVINLTFRSPFQHKNFAKQGKNIFGPVTGVTRDFVKSSHYSWPTNK